MTSYHHRLKKRYIKLVLDIKRKHPKHTSKKIVDEIMDMRNPSNGERYTCVPSSREVGKIIQIYG